MNSSNISEILCEYLDDRNEKTLLINGPWGCGKTYAIKQYIKSNKHNKIYYISLFGLESVDEINTALYQCVHPRKKILFHELGVLSKAVKAFPIIPDMGEALEYQLGIINNQRIKRRIIIFDDLERLSEKVMFTELLGYFNSLLLGGCKIVCIISIDNLSDKRKKDFDDFKEKVFDSILFIDESNDRVFASVFDSLYIPGIEEIYPIFNSNIRLAQKTILFFNKVKVKCSDTNRGVFSELEIMKACAYAVCICFGVFKITEQQKEQLSYYEIYSAHYGADIANGLASYSNVRSEDFLIPRFIDLVIALVKAFLHRDYSQINTFFYHEKENEPNILEKIYYYLSDDNKAKYEEKIIEKIKSGDFEWNDQFITQIKQIVNTCTELLNPEIIELIAEKIVFCSENLYLIDLNWQLFSSDNNDFLNSFKNLLQDTLDKKIVELTNKQLDDNYKDGNWEKQTKLLDYICNWNSSRKNYILEHIITRNFYFPDLSKDLTHEIWTYAHHTCQFIKSANLNKEFIKYVEKQHRTNPDNKSLNDRYKTLVNQYLDASFVFA